MGVKNRRLGYSSKREHKGYHVHGAVLDLAHRPIRVLVEYFIAHVNRQIE